MPATRGGTPVENYHPRRIPVRAHSQISTGKSGRVFRADIVLISPRDTVELIGHEIEHVIERVAGVRLREQGCLATRPSAISTNPAVPSRSGVAWRARLRKVSVEGLNNH
jgi:hypothetical protein